MFTSPAPDFLVDLHTCLKSSITQSKNSELGCTVVRIEIGWTVTPAPILQLVIHQNAGHLANSGFVLLLPRSCVKHNGSAEIVSVFGFRSRSDKSQALLDDRIV